MGRMWARCGQLVDEVDGYINHKKSTEGTHHDYLNDQLMFGYLPGVDRRYEDVALGAGTTTAAGRVSSPVPSA